MCLVTEQKKPIEIRKDLIVFKSVSIGKKMLSPFQYFELELNKLYCTTLRESDWIRVYDNLVLVTYHLNLFDLDLSIKRQQLTVIGEGFHAFTNIKRANEEFDTVKCIIPKGSLIYKDKTGLIVSNQIILKEIIN